MTRRSGAVRRQVRATTAVARSPERLMLSTEVQDRVNRAMAALSQMERAAFVLRHFEGQSIEEISRALGPEDERGETQHLSRGEQDAARARALCRHE